jgi:tetratricopeptide (TPR) repeat protein
MRLPVYRGARAIAVCAIVAIMGAGYSASAQNPGYPQSPNYPTAPSPQDRQDRKDKGAQPSDGERQAATKVTSAADFNAALQAAGEFVKKYPKSSLRPEITRHLVAKAAANQDSAQQVTMLESALAALKDPGDAEIINPAILDAYQKAQKYDDAFRVTAAIIEKNPNDLVTLTWMAIVGIEQAKAQNPKFVPQSLQYAPKAIELIETDKRPTGLDDAQWAEYKTKWLAQLYQSLGVYSMMTGDFATARTKLEKSASISQYDPITYVYLGSLVQEEYVKLAQQVKSMLPGKAQDETLKRALEKMDQMIDLYAKAIGLSDGNLQYQKMRDELSVDLKSYYSYRHGNSAEGLQQLIDKYKRPHQQ